MELVGLSLPNFMEHQTAVKLAVEVYTESVVAPSVWLAVFASPDQKGS